jgi:hypothetical protein
MFFLLLTLLLLPCTAAFAMDYQEQRPQPTFSREKKVYADLERREHTNKHSVVRAPFGNPTRKIVKMALDVTEASTQFQRMNFDEYEPELATLSEQLFLQKQHRNCPNT